MHGSIYTHYIGHTVFTGIAGIGETKEVPVRLAEGATRHEGRVEVFHEGEWGTACSDFFGGDNNACNVVCNQLGFR